MPAVNPFGFDYVQFWLIERLFRGRSKQYVAFDPYAQPVWVNDWRVAYEFSSVEEATQYQRKHRLVASKIGGYVRSKYMCTTHSASISISTAEGR